MTYASTTTLRAIRVAGPCRDGWTKLLAGLGKTCADNKPLDLLTILDIVGLDDALWVLSYAMPDDRLARHFQSWCAEQVLHIFEAARPGDMRIRDQIAMLRRDDATAQERAAARAAAVAAAWDVAKTAARTSAAAAVRDAAVAAAWAAAEDAGFLAARDAARAAGLLAAMGAGFLAARDAARAAAWDAQENQLRMMLSPAKMEDSQ